MDEKIINKLLDIEAIILRPEEPFTWISGLKSPVYCDNRLIISYPKLRRIVYQELIKIIETHFKDVQVIAGTSTSGIPFASWIAEELSLPLIYVRSKKKEYGKTKMIEGLYPKDKKVVVIEDNISTGRSSLNVVKAIQEQGGIVLGVAAIFSYNLLRAKISFENAQIPVFPICNYQTLLQVAKKRGIENMPLTPIL